MPKDNIPYMKSPCDNCPFRKDSQGIKLNKERAEEISLQNVEDGFVCHKTVNYSIRQGDEDLNRKQCAGALILAKKTNTYQPFRALFLGIFKKDLDLHGQDLIVDNYEDFINIHS